MPAGGTPHFSEPLPHALEAALFLPGTGHVGLREASV